MLITLNEGVYTVNKRQEAGNEIDRVARGVC